MEHRAFPPTRYQGSKLKRLDWIWRHVQPLPCDTVLDLFGGTGCVSYLFKTQGKAVTFNDSLRANYLAGKALIENATVRLDGDDIGGLFAPQPGRSYGDFIQRTFPGIFYLDEENAQLDVLAGNLAAMEDPYKQALGYHAVFQACIAKRPYNLFHRANLYMRTALVKRSFGNKTAWDRPLWDHVCGAAALASAAVFDNGRKNRALCMQAESIEATADLVYIDPPYMNRKGKSVDYLDFYHFLEGLSEYGEWPRRIDPRYKHRPYARRPSPWLEERTVLPAFDEVFARFPRSILVVSYRDNGIPAPEELLSLLRRHRTCVTVERSANHQYALSRTPSRELLYIAR